MPEGDTVRGLFSVRRIKYVCLLRGKGWFSLGVNYLVSSSATSGFTCDAPFIVQNINQLLY